MPPPMSLAGMPSINILLKLELPPLMKTDVVPPPRSRRSVTAAPATRASSGSTTVPAIDADASWADTREVRQRGTRSRTRNRRAQAMRRHYVRSMTRASAGEAEDSRRQQRGARKKRPEAERSSAYLLSSQKVDRRTS